MRELHMISRALRAAEGNKSKAADVLGMSRLFYLKMREYDLGD